MSTCQPPQPLHDKDIREPLFDYLEEKYGRIRILEEKTTGRARADCVMITEGTDRNRDQVRRGFLFPPGPADKSI